MTKTVSKTTNEAMLQPWRITTNSFAHLGLQKNDTVYLNTDDWQQNGAWLIVCFNGRYHLRELQILAGNWRLQPLSGNLQSIDWPMHVPLTVVGRIVRMERELAANNL